MKKLLLILISLFTLTASSNLCAQKALGKPIAFERPFDYSADKVKAKEQITTGTRNKSKKEAWLVISDRENNEVYDKPNGSKNGVVNFKTIKPHIADNTLHSICQKASFIIIILVISYIS